MENSVQILDELRELSATKSSESRRALLHRITDLFVITSDEQEPDHKAAFDQIMDRLTFELETSVRAEFADRLADMPNAPTRLTHKLAIDEIDVARPVLTRSKILSDEFLVKVAKTQSQDHLLAICNRENINVKVTDAIVERGNDEVLMSVSSNKGANFSRNSFEKLTQTALDNSALNSILHERSDTPADLLETIKKRVADKIKAETAANGIDISEDEIDDTIEKKSQNIETTEAERKAAFQEIDYLHSRNQLDERVIIHYVKLQRTDETVYCLHLMTGLDQGTVKHCLLHADLPALAVLCKSNSFERSTFASLLQLRENISETSGTQIVEAIRRYESLDKASAERVMRFLKVRGSAEAAKKQNQENEQEHNSGEEEAPKEKLSFPLQN
jgi:uncharacterized protein (DUF2336 family)